MSSTEISNGNGEVRLAILERVRDSQIERLKREPARRDQRIHRVILPIRKKNPQLYDPAIVSIGPYHHNKPNLNLAELYKPKSLELFIARSGKDKEFLYKTIFDEVDEIRSCYEGVDNIEDGALAEMMLLDICFLIHLLEIFRGGKGDEENVQMFQEHFQTTVLPFIWRDFLLLENQIPLKLLISTMSYGGEGETIICDFISKMVDYDEMLTLISIPGKNEEQSLHLLEAFRRLLIIKSGIHEPAMRFRYLKLKKNKQQFVKFNKFKMTFSVTELVLRGIYFRPGPDKCLTNITFTSCLFFGILRLPIWFINSNTKQFFTNIIAHEATFEGSVNNHLQVNSYIIFMKSLIKSPEDVKELREKNIIYSDFGSDSEIVKLIQEIDTFEYGNENRFPDFRYKIGEYCRNKGMTWMAESFHTNFRTIALLATGFIMCLTFLQTYFTINPADGSTLGPSTAPV